MVSPVSEPGGRFRQQCRRGLKHSVRDAAVSGTLSVPWRMFDKDNVSKVLALRIVNKAGLESPFGPRAKMAILGRSASIDGEPTHLKTLSVYRDVLTRTICESCGT